jgi:hypothetical protein
VGIIYLLETKFISYKACLRTGKNKFVELTALNLILTTIRDQNITFFQVMGDTLIVINWMKSIYRMESLTLSPIFYQLKIMEALFTIISYKHMYRELNPTTNTIQRGLGGCTRVLRVV